VRTSQFQSPSETIADVQEYKASATSAFKTGRFLVAFVGLSGRFGCHPTITARPALSMKI
jgi:hypothetical protein